MQMATSYVAEPGIADLAHFEPGLAGTPPPPTLPFPGSGLGLKAEIQLAGVWTDISPYLQHDQQDSQSHPAAVNITRGRQDELATSATPQEATLKVWNGDGRFCSKKPDGPYYPNLTRNTPLRISYPGTTGTVSTYLSLASDEIAYASCPDTASLDITGQIDVRIDLIPESLPVMYGGTTFGGEGFAESSLVGKWSDISANNSWAFVLHPSGRLGFWWHSAASNVLYSSVPIQIGARIALRCVFVPSTGTATFYTAPNMGGTFTQLGTAQVFGATTMQSGAGTPISVGFVTTWSPLVAQVNEVQIYNSSAVLVADPVFSSQTAGATSFTDAQANTWSLTTPASIVSFGSSSRNYRFYGQISSLPVTWDPTGNDVWASITASGVIRRLQQGNQPPVFSTMRRFLQTSPPPFTPLALWPCEDEQGSTAIASALSGAPQMQITGTPNFGANSSLACASSLPTINGSMWIGNVPNYTATNAAVIRFLMTVPATTSTVNGAVILRAVLSGGTCAYIEVYYGTGGTLTFHGINAAGGTVFTVGPGFNVLGFSGMVALEIGTLQGVMQEALRTMAPGQTSFNLNATTSLTPGRVAQVIVNPGLTITDISVGMIAVLGASEDMGDLNYPMNAWLGEPAGVRFARLCQENNIQPRVDGVAGYTQAMGYQVPDTLMNLLQSCEDTDRGQIYDPRDFLGLAYRTLDSLESQSVALTLDYNQDHMTPPLTPTDDDLYIVNDVTVTNTTGSSAFGGSSAVAQLNDGSVMSIGVIGDYANSYNVSTQSDRMLPDVAGWILNTGINNDERYPSVVVNLASSQPQIAAITSTVESLDIGAYAQIVNTPSFLPPGPVNLLVWGYSEMLGDFCNEITFNTIPEGPYEVAVADDNVRGRAETAGSAVVQAVSPSVTTLPVGAVVGDSWTTAGGDLPFDINVSGERMTVTAVGAVSNLVLFSDDFETGVSGWTPSNCTFAQSGAQHHTGSFSGLMTPVSSPAFMWVTDNTPIPMAPGMTCEAAGWLFSTGTPLCYMELDFFDVNNNLLLKANNPPGAVALVASTWTFMGTIAVAPAGTSYCKMLFVSQAPGANTVFVDGAGTSVNSQQAFTVTRSVNGIIKSHNVGEAVGLWLSPVAALAQ